VNVSLVGWANGYEGVWSISGTIADAGTLTGEPTIPVASASLRAHYPIHARTTSALSGSIQMADVSSAAGGCYPYYTGVYYHVWDVMAET